jgi:hypothetical protein
MSFIEELKDALYPEYGRLLQTRLFQALTSDEKAGGGKYPRPIDPGRSTSGKRTTTRSTTA